MKEKLTEKAISEDLKLTVQQLRNIKGGPGPGDGHDDDDSGDIIGTSK